MIAARSQHVGRIVKVALALVAISALISVRAAEQPAPAPESRETLKRAVEARFDVIPLSRGVALAGRTLDRRVEIAGGVVLSEGAPLSGAELRRRFGADADLVLRLSYLSDDELRTLFSRALPAAPASPPAASTPPPLPPAIPASPPPPRTATPPAGPRTEPPPPPAPPPVTGPVYRRTGARIAIAKPIVVAADEDVRDGIFSVGGPVRVDGRVRDEIVVVGSRLELGPTAEVRGDITLVGGELITTPGARHTGQVHQVVAADWPRWAWPSISWSWFQPGGAASWLPLAGTTTRVLLLALATALVALVARGRVARIGAAAAATPIRAGLIGLAAQVVFVPAIVVLAFVMAITIVGLPFIAIVVPLAVLTLFAAMLFGFAGVAQRVGARLGDQLGWAESAVAGAALIGLAIIVLPTVVARLLGLGPDWMRGITLLVLGLGMLVEYVAWTIGLGAAIQTGLGRWAVVPPPVPPPTFDSMADARSTS